eukprot:scaffold30029_cov34-Phaeocystis_antarctica.AAC.4
MPPSAGGQGSLCPPWSRCSCLWAAAVASAAARDSCLCSSSLRLSTRRRDASESRRARRLASSCEASCAWRAWPPAVSTTCDVSDLPSPSPPPPLPPCRPSSKSTLRERLCICSARQRKRKRKRKRGGKKEEGEGGQRRWWRRWWCGWC